MDPKQTVTPWEAIESSTITKVSQMNTPKNYSQARLNGLRLAGMHTESKTGHALAAKMNEAGCKQIKDGFQRTDQCFVPTKSVSLPGAVAKGQQDLIIGNKLEFKGKTVIFTEVLQKNWDFYDEPSSTPIEIEVDVVIQCTGYQSNFDWLKGVDFDWNPRTWFRQSIPPRHQDHLAFLGWTRPHQGGIPPCSEMLSRYLALLWTGQKTLPEGWEEQAEKEGKFLHEYWPGGKNLASLVDFPSFMTSMGRLIGCEPRPPPIWRFNRYIQYYTFPFWPVFYRQRGLGAKPELVEQVLSKFETWDGHGPKDHSAVRLSYYLTN
jgi:hypothetical protein